MGIASGIRNGKAIGILVAVAVAATAFALLAIRDDAEAISFQYVEVDADDQTLLVALNSCHADAVVVVRETATEVVLDVTGSPTNRDCEDVERLRLAEPLGDRPIIDGATGRDVGPPPSDR